MVLIRCMCFFLFYGMHTEPEFDYRIELYHIAKFIMYATTVMNIIGINLPYVSALNLNGTGLNLPFTKTGSPVVMSTRISSAS